jgi:hypothetical protein
VSANATAIQDPTVASEDAEHPAWGREMLRMQLNELRTLAKLNREILDELRHQRDATAFLREIRDVMVEIRDVIRGGAKVHPVAMPVPGAR